MKLLIIIIAITPSNISLFAQSMPDPSVTRPSNIVSTNLFGEASVLSFNYERIYELFISFF